ncbi:MAG: hypothetical protein KR126chlam2_00654 [Chlamydiae bacterium]|nr:hypothetical protein [Chlamydiota bacterium]
MSCSCVDREGLGIHDGTRGNASLALMTISGVALFVIACMGATAAMTGLTFGVAFSFVSGGILVLSLAARKWSARKHTPLAVTTVVLVSLVAMGVFTAIGFLTAVQISWIFLGTMITFGTIGSLVGGCCWLTNTCPR